ncbi:hypothetical protein HYPSUDRAFT_128746 [Hypholoma sublateritium FD-334 SS-4]|uniref:Uncharacterized protein n=1 Tax=Hypholoma sublateritium (strain FD-334 SS-4) TaxID=945553 RepID=A0A0D2LLJ2_HYPSF|nr:hypothetical protein HYPSUDRAFT_128746 [Hypholoma sublateritium FD-334 SS-4]
MSHTSPASYLVWSIITAVLGAFLIFHLWSFDRFKCLRWNSGAGSGTFKRVMTYSYLVTIPMVFTFAIGNTIIKYREGFILHPTLGIIPKPYQLWDQHSRATIFPFMLLFSIGWSFEMVTHLEELCFWLFLINSGSGQQNWFRSLYFRIWVVGSALAVVYMPLVTILTRSDPLKSEAFTFLAGSLGSLSLTLWFTPILWTFPTFLNNLRVEGVDVATIVRLTKFSELNLHDPDTGFQTIRVVFRYLFTLPLLILGADGVRPHTHINESMMWTDFLVMIAGFGCCISSGITLVIFFPRSIEGEIAARDEARERRRTKSMGNSTGAADAESIHRQTSSYGGTYLLTASPIKKPYDLQSMDDINDTIPYQAAKDTWDEDESRDIPAELPPMVPNRRKLGRDIEMARVESLTETNLSMHNFRESNVNPMISNFTSPIGKTIISSTRFTPARNPRLMYFFTDFAQGSSAEDRNGSRLTFNRR